MTDLENSHLQALLIFLWQYYDYQRAVSINNSSTTY